MQDVYHSAHSHTNGPISYCRIVVFSVIVLFVLVLSIYSNSFDCSWHFDDEPNITDNPNLHPKEITWQNLKRAIFSGRNNPTMPYRPVACLTLALNHYVGGLNVFGYHLVNAIIHLITAIFLFLFIYRTLNLPSLRTKYALQSYFIALLATILWAINPVQTQAVTYIVQRMASMAGMFYIMSMYFYLRARTIDTKPKKIILFTVCFISFLMAFGSKENAAMLPLIIFLYEILFFQQITKEGFRKYGWLFLIIVGAILVLGFAYIYGKRGNVFSFLDGYENRPFTLAQRLLTEPRILIFYITLLLYPVPNRLSIAHSVHLSMSLFDPIWTSLSILFILGAIGYSVYLAKRQPLFSFCIIFFFLNHVIESTIFPLELVFEHRNYIPSMLFFLPIAIGFASLLKLYEKKKAMKSIISAFIVLLLIGLGHGTFIRNSVWKNDKTLWTDAVQKTPNHFRPHHNLGTYYQNHRNNKMAILEYQTALEKPPSDRLDESFVTYYNLGKIYNDLKDYEKALSYYHKALSINPQYPPIYNNIAGIFDRQGKYELAHTYLLDALRLRPGSTVTNFNLGLYYLRKGQPDKAIYHLERVSDGKEFGEMIPYYFGIGFKQKGHLGRAVTFFKKALKRNPRNIKLYLHMAEVFYRLGEYERAGQETDKAINLIPDKNIFHKILADLQKDGQSHNLQPSADIVIPLIRESCLRRSETLKEWGCLLEEKSPAAEDE
jgi:tetratricopeptide (TPR) repeat protein